MQNLAPISKDFYFGNSLTKVKGKSDLLLFNSNNMYLFQYILGHSFLLSSRSHKSRHHKPRASNQNLHDGQRGSNMFDVKINLYCNAHYVYSLFLISLQIWMWSGDYFWSFQEQHSWANDTSKLYKLATVELSTGTYSITL